MPKNGKHGYLHRKRPRRSGFGEHADPDFELGLAPLKSRIPEVSLLAAMVDDAIRVLREGEPQEGDWNFEERHQAWRETVWWFFLENNPQRPFSLEWCIHMINNAHHGNESAERMRREALREGLCPMKLLSPQE